MPTFLRRMFSKKDVDASVALHVRDLCGSVGKFEDLLRNGKDEDEVIGLFLEVARRTWVGDDPPPEFRTLILDGITR
jgi:hypothetical protein